jgi:hypothetical protein
VALALPAAAQNIGEEGGWQFRSAAQTQVLGSNLSLIELQRSGYYDQFKGGALGAGAGGIGGGAGNSTTGFAANASLTNNFYQVYNSTTNNCASSGAVGAPISCGSGAVSSSGTSLTTSGSTVSTANTVSGNTLDQHDNPQTTTNNTSVDQRKTQ